MSLKREKKCCSEDLNQRLYTISYQYSETQTFFKSIKPHRFVSIFLNEDIIFLHLLLGKILLKISLKISFMISFIITPHETNIINIRSDNLGTIKPNFDGDMKANWNQFKRTVKDDLVELFNKIIFRYLILKQRDYYILYNIICRSLFVCLSICLFVCPFAILFFSLLMRF